MIQRLKEIESLIDLAITEDIGDGDHTSRACIPSKTEGSAKLLVKQNGILAGVLIALQIFDKINANLRVDVKLNDGAVIVPGDEVFTVHGSVHSILHAERLVLNFMQRMSGIATQTHNYTSLIADLPTKILDTRKTTPGLRAFEKMAVKIGGAENHRHGLYDMILIKDNHVDYAGGIKNAISNAKNYLVSHNKTLQIEIEVRNFFELDDVLSVGGVDRIMLDNFSVSDTRKAVTLINNRFETESSGGITFENLRDYALCGVTYISVGALTHKINSIDLSLKAY